MMMELKYPARSSFYAPIENALRGVRDDLAQPLVVQLPPGGYDREAHIYIDEADRHTFRTDWQSRHPSRFSARVRAAAGSLYRLGFRGHFWAHHHDGALTLRRS